MKIIALGTSEFIVSCVKGLINSGHEIQCLVSKPEDSYPINSINISKVAEYIEADYYETEDINSIESCKYLRSFSPDIIFSAWPNLINKTILDIPKYGVIGTHPTSLPLNRGRHPLHWLIVLGIKKTDLSFFIMNEEVDSGPILHQEEFNVASNIKDTIKELNSVAFDASVKVGKLLFDQKSINNSIKQDHSNSNTWRKRTLFDVTIDFRMCAKDIIALVNSFKEPFSGAIIVNHDAIYHVNDAMYTDKNELPSYTKNIEHGSILNVGKNMLRVKTGDKFLDIFTKEPLNNSIRSQKYIHPPIKYIIDNSDLRNYFS